MRILEEELYQAAMALAACPTAPCHEAHVCSTVRELLSGLESVTIRLDEFGNLHAIYAHPSSRREPFRMVAHMDHPGLVVHESTDGRELHLAGGIEESYLAGAKIVFHHEATKAPVGRATIIRPLFSGEAKRVEIAGSIPPEATFAVWDLPKARCTKTLFIGPACDDLAQVATMVALLRKLSRSQAETEVHGLFTRGEEIGFAGAFAALRAKAPLPAMTTLSLEASRAAGFAKVGAGAIVRVGDRSSIFDSKVTQWLETAFREMRGLKSGAAYQRLLMGGGTCEASVFQRFGWPTGALCVALNNYHNMGAGAAIRSESISLRDWQGLLDFLFFLANDAKSIDETDAAMTERFTRLEEKGIAALKKKTF